MKYFYTDPIAAAWMKRHFGIDFLRPACGASDAPYTIEGILYYAEAVYKGTTTIRFTIHPDSLHILEPQFKDHGLVYGEGPVFFNVMNEWVHEDINRIVEHNVKVSITRRNNMHFMWPESEA